MKNALALYYTAVNGHVAERRIVPLYVKMHKHHALPEREWFLVAWDIDAASECHLRLSGCDFTQGNGVL